MVQDMQIITKHTNTIHLLDSLFLLWLQIWRLVVQSTPNWTILLQTKSILKVLVVIPKNQWHIGRIKVIRTDVLYIHKNLL